METGTGNVDHRVSTLRAGPAMTGNELNEIGRATGALTSAREADYRGFL